MTELSETYPKTSIIVSSRPDNRFSAWTSFSVCEIQGFNKQQVIKFISLLDFDAGVKRRFKREVQRRLYETHGTFLSYPLLTTIMLLTFTEYAEIPSKFHAFFSRAFDTLMLKHDSMKDQLQREFVSGLSREDFKTCVSAFCALSYLDNRISFSESDLIKAAGNSIKYCGQIDPLFKRVDPKNLCKDIIDAVCLLHRNGDEMTFVHRQFQEYFTALFVTRLPKETVRDVINVCCGRPADSVVSMTFDLNPNLIEQEWTLPTIAYIESQFIDCRTKSAASKFCQISQGAVLIISNKIHKDRAPVLFVPKFRNDYEMLCRLYPKELKNSSAAYIMIEYFRSQTIIGKLLDVKFGDEDFSKEIQRLIAKPEVDGLLWSITEKDNWWLEDAPILHLFDQALSGFTTIRASISS